MVINVVVVKYYGGFLPYINILLTQAPVFVWFDGIIIVYFYYTLLIMYYNSVFCFVMLRGSARHAAPSPPQVLDSLHRLAKAQSRRPSDFLSEHACQDGK